MAQVYAVRSVLAGYRPIELSSAAGSTINVGPRTTYADRRRAAAERLSKTADIAQQLDAAVKVTPEGVPSEAVGEPGPVDPDGTLRASIRALLPLAYRSSGFDVTVSLGPEHHWAARLRHDPDGVTAELVPGAGRSPDHHQVTTAQGEVAAELAAWLWSGAVKLR
jgi:hypothetical protein